MENIEGVGENFSVEKFMLARDKTKEVVEKVAASVYTGMTEKDGHQLIDDVLREYGATKKWHPNKFRIGTNTTKSFREKSEEVTLKENDLFFIDIGPVFDDHEGDYGDTFIHGSNTDFEKISMACREVFNEAAAAFKSQALSGEKLYSYAGTKAKELGFELNLNMTGHRLGDFPHAVFFKGKLAEMDFTPKKDLWVLEIQIVHPSGEYGAFFEDLL